MKIYEVGGAVRDELLGLPVQDRDYVVVGATPEEMVRLGFRPVGKDFPVFLHPKTNDEYALARTERKTARGYKGFQVYAASDVTLEQDLLRRDLTINAIAKDDVGAYIDPHGGIADLRAGILRHVSAAFVEDPVRVLRVARFAARYPFSIAPETMALMREMVRAGEVDALVPERVWQEFAKGLMEANPARMFEVLEECGALARVLPEWTVLDRATALRALQNAAARRATLAVRFAVLFAGAAIDAVASASERVRAPADCRDLAMLLAAQGATLTQGAALSAAALVALFHAVDAWRRPERFDLLLDASRCAAAAERRAEHDRAMERIRRALAVAVAVDAGAVASAHPDDIPGALRSARVAAVESALV